MDHCPKILWYLSMLLPGSVLLSVCHRIVRKALSHQEVVKIMATSHDGADSSDAEKSETVLPLLPACPKIDVKGIALPENIGGVADAMVPAKSSAPWHQPTGGVNVGLRVNNTLTSSSKLLLYVLVPILCTCAFSNNWHLVCLWIYVRRSNHLER